MDYIVSIKVKEIRGRGICPHGHQVGETFRIGDARLCPWAAHTLMPFAAAFRFGGEVPWRDTDRDRIDIACPDPDNVVVFRLTRQIKPEGAEPGW
jgi:uncharacterized repeat protein (TIGR04076 family)